MLMYAMNIYDWFFQERENEKTQGNEERNKM